MADSFTQLSDRRTFYCKDSDAYSGRFLHNSRQVKWRVYFREGRF